MQAVSVEVYNLVYDDNGLSLEAICVLSNFLSKEIMLDIEKYIDVHGVKAEILEKYLNSTGTGTYMIIPHKISGMISITSLQIIRSFVKPEFLEWIGRQGYILVDIFKDPINLFGYKYQRWGDLWQERSERNDSNTFTTQQLIEKYHNFV